jgi:hypothetical protein
MTWPREAKPGPDDDGPLPRRRGPQCVAHGKPVEPQTAASIRGHLPGPLDSQHLALAMLLSVTASLLVGRFHQQRKNENRAAGVFAGTALWPILVILIVVCRVLGNPLPPPARSVHPGRARSTAIHRDPGRRHGSPSAATPSTQRQRQGSSHDEQQLDRQHTVKIMNASPDTVKLRDHRFGDRAHSGWQVVTGRNWRQP